jgi:hypothetical protein
MKKAYMVEIELPEEPDLEFYRLIPDQRAAINKMMEAGKILSYSLSLDRMRLWVVMAAESEFDVLDCVGDFPMIQYMKPEVTELMFHQMATSLLPISLN